MVEWLQIPDGTVINLGNVMAFTFAPVSGTEECSLTANMVNGWMIVVGCFDDESAARKWLAVKLKPVPDVITRAAVARGISP